MYVDGGADATDTCDVTPIGVTTTLTDVDVVVPDVIISNPTADTIGGIVNYSAVDVDGNIRTATREVTVTRSQPVIKLPNVAIGLDLGETYFEQGMDILDAQDGDLTSITTSGSSSGLTYIIDSSAVDVGNVGSYEVTYNAVDSNGNNATQVILTVNVGVLAAHSNFTMLDPGGVLVGGTNDIVFVSPATVAAINGDLSSLNIAATDIDFNMTITSATPQLFFGALLHIHHVRVFGPGSYSFEADNTLCESKATSPDTQNTGFKTLTPAANDIDVTGCPGTGGPKTISMVVNVGQFGAHMLFDYNGSFDLDVVNVWNVNAPWNNPDGAVSPVNDMWKGEAITSPDGLPPSETLPMLLSSSDVNGDGINGAPLIDGSFESFYLNFSAGTQTMLACDFPEIPNLAGDGCMLVDCPESTVLNSEGQCVSPTGSGSFGIMLSCLLPLFRLCRKAVRLKLD